MVVRDEIERKMKEMAEAIGKENMNNYRLNTSDIR
jgi:hypothetical protein